jgi:5-methylcytosine-specific restriction protein A
MILRACPTCGTPTADGYCAEHKPKPWAGSRRREQMGISGGRWQTIRRRVLDRDLGTCYLCDQAGADTVDHLIPVADGGTSRLDNLASAHADCHERRHEEPDWAQPRIDMALRVLGGCGVPERRVHASGTDRGAGGARRSEVEGA